MHCSGTVHSGKISLATKNRLKYKVINNPECLAYMLTAKLGKSPNLCSREALFAYYLYVI